MESDKQPLGAGMDSKWSGEELQLQRQGVLMLRHKGLTGAVRKQAAGKTPVIHTSAIT